MCLIPLGQIELASAVDLGGHVAAGERAQEIPWSRSEGVVLDIEIADGLAIHPAEDPRQV